MRPCPNRTHWHPGIGSAVFFAHVGTRSAWQGPIKIPTLNLLLFQIFNQKASQLRPSEKAWDTNNQGGWEGWSNFRMFFRARSTSCIFLIFVPSPGWAPPGPNHQQERDLSTCQVREVPHRRGPFSFWKLSILSMFLHLSPSLSICAWRIANIKF